MRKIDVPPLFGKTKALENQIDEYLDKLSEAGMAFEQGATRYIERGFDESCEEKMTLINDLEQRCDELYRNISRTLYSEMLIPESRGDVLELLNELEGLMDGLKHNFRDVTILRRQVPELLKDDLKELVTAVVKCVELTVQSARAYFRDINAVRDHVHKIEFFESEADRVALRLIKKVFDSEAELAEKLLAREAVNAINAIADTAEDIGDMLMIFAIKRAE